MLAAIQHNKAARGPLGFTAPHSCCGDWARQHDKIKHEFNCMQITTGTEGLWNSEHFIVPAVKYVECFSQHSSDIFYQDFLKDACMCETVRILKY